jgi:hypothetical protein
VSRRPGGPPHGEAARDEARPLLARGRLVTVDGHPVCAGCGRAVVPADGGRWEHLPPGRPFPRRSRWFAPVAWPVLRGLRTYREFTARYPWTVRPELCGGVVTTEDDWREGTRRLREYHAELAAARRRRRPLTTGENPYLDLVRILAGGSEPRWHTVPGGLASVLDLSGRRRELAAVFAWAIPDEGALDLLAGYGPLLECGAGTGYWAALLRARGCDVLACDLDPPRRTWTDVRAADAVAFARACGDRALFLCWPPYEDDRASYSAVRAYRGDTLLYVGGGPDGPTGTVRFHRELALNWHPAEQAAVPAWRGLRDRLVVYRRNPVRRGLSQRDRCPECRRFAPTGSAGRCDRCFTRNPPALALRANGLRVEYPREVVDAMPAGLRLAFEASPSRIRLLGLRGGRGRGDPLETRDQRLPLRSTANRRRVPRCRGVHGSARPWLPLSRHASHSRWLCILTG